MLKQRRDEEADVGRVSVQRHVGEGEGCVVCAEPDCYEEGVSILASEFFQETVKCWEDCFGCVAVVSKLDILLETGWLGIAYPAWPVGTLVEIVELYHDHQKP